MPFLGCWSLDCYIGYLPKESYLALHSMRIEHGMLCGCALYCIHVFCSCVMFVPGEDNTVKWPNLEEALVLLMRKILDQLPPNDRGWIYQCLTRFVLHIDHFHLLVCHYGHFVVWSKTVTNYPAANTASLRGWGEVAYVGISPNVILHRFMINLCSTFNFIYYSYWLGGRGFFSSHESFWRNADIWFMDAGKEREIWWTNSSPSTACFAVWQGNAYVDSSLFSLSPPSKKEGGAGGGMAVEEIGLWTCHWLIAMFMLIFYTVLIISMALM